MKFKGRRETVTVHNGDSPEPKCVVSGNGYVELKWRCGKVDSSGLTSLFRLFSSDLLVQYPVGFPRSTLCHMSHRGSGISISFGL